MIKQRKLSKSVSLCKKAEYSKVLYVKASFIALENNENNFDSVFYD